MQSHYFLIVGSLDHSIFFSVQPSIEAIIINYLLLDHVAVVLFVHGEVGQLTLHLPVKWEKNKFVEKTNDSKSKWICPGQSANKLHKQFSEKMKEDTLGHIETALLLGAKRSVHDGFQQRNTEVAKSQFLIAFTWGEGSEPKKGGTLDTWGKCIGRKVHIPLQSLESTKTREKDYPDDNDIQSLGTAKPILFSRKRGYSGGDIMCDGPKRSKLETDEQ